MSTEDLITSPPVTSLTTRQTAPYHESGSRTTTLSATGFGLTCASSMEDETEDPPDVSLGTVYATVSEYTVHPPAFVRRTTYEPLYWPIQRLPLTYAVACPRYAQNG